MKLLRFLALLFAFTGSALAITDSKADAQKAEEAREEKILSELKFQSGNISILEGRAELKLGDQFEYLDAADTRKLIVDYFHNPPDAGTHTGTIVPKGWGRKLFAGSWVAVLDWREDGYVKDADYDSLDFNKKLNELKEASHEDSDERVRQGYSKMILTGWAQPPHYDKATHKLYWAKSFDDGEPPEQLNYDIRVLGRAGVLEVSIVSTMPRLAQIQTQAPSILGAIEFTPNNRYSDYKAGDKVAAYGIGGLIGIGVLAKVGAFKGLWLLLLKGGKLVWIGIVAIGSWIARLFGRRKQA